MTLDVPERATGEATRPAPPPGASAMVAAAIERHGTAAQRARLLPRIRAGLDVCCLGLCEHAHGSDLASVRTTGLVTGDEIALTGRKAWVSGADRADTIAVLCRTDLDVPRHRGLTYVLVPLGPHNRVEVRPVRRMDGGADLFEVVLEGALAPLGSAIGGLGNGWGPATTTLAHARGGDAQVQQLALEAELWDLVREAERCGLAAEPEVRAELVRAYQRLTLLRLTALRRAARPAAGAAPEPEAAMAGVLRGEHRRRFGELALEIAGAAGLVRPGGPGYPTTRWQAAFLSGRAGTVASGASEVLRDVIAERILGLPREAPAAVPGLR
jgi:alkylation response protein AidB-like acyl-CoA dehydrogenase